jgi:hypothetical protein
MPEPHFENVLPEPLLGIFRRLKGRLERRRNMEELVELAQAITGYVANKPIAGSLGEAAAAVHHCWDTGVSFSIQRELGEPSRMRS